MRSTFTSASALPRTRIFGEPQLHTDAEVLALAFAPDQTLRSIEDSGVLRHWNGISGQELEWTSLNDLDTLWLFSDDGHFLASASDDVTLWDAATGRQLVNIPQSGWVDALAWGKDNQFIATGHDDGVVRYWEASGRLAREFRLHKKAISALAFDSAGKVLAAASEDKVISLWEVATGKHVGNLTGSTDRIPALAWQPGTRILVSAGWDTSARVWDTEQREPIILLNAHDQQVTAVAFDAQGRLLATADSSHAVYVWDFASKKCQRRFHHPQADVYCLAFSRDGGLLAASGGRLIHVWDVAAGVPLGGCGARPTAPTHLALARSDQRLASNCGGSQPRVWSLGSDSAVTLNEQQTVHSLRFTPDGTMVAGAASTHVRLWDAATGQPKLDLEGPDEPITVVALSPDGQTVAGAGSMGTGVWLWSASDGEPILLIPDALQGCTIESLAFHPAGQYLAVGGIDWMATGGSSGAISIWDIAHRYEVSTHPAGTTCLAYHPSGNRLAFATLESSIGIWDPMVGEPGEGRLLAELIGHEGAVSALAYSADGSLLASGGADRTIRLWDEEGEEAAVIEVDSQVTDLAFSPDGQYLFSANANTTCYQFRLADVLKK